MVILGQGTVPNTDAEEPAGWQNGSYRQVRGRTVIVTGASGRRPGIRIAREGGRVIAVTWPPTGWRSSPTSTASSK